MKTAVITMAIGKDYDLLGQVSHPTLQKYAGRIGADFICIQQAMISAETPHWNKYLLREYLDNFDRVIYFDTDLIIREDCPNLFDIVPADRIGIFNEGLFVSRINSISEAINLYDRPLKKGWKGDYYNTGVMVLSSCHKELFTLPQKIINTGMFEQSYLNLDILDGGWKTFELSYHFNRMTIMDTLTGEHRRASYIVHYAGAPSVEEVLKIMLLDKMMWKKEATENYIYPKTLVFRVNGGLGDQICSEPIIRYAKKYMFPNDRIIVTTHFPEIFNHFIEEDIAEVYSHGINMTFNDTPFKIFDTMPDPKDSNLWYHVTHPLSHSVDWISLATLKRFIPDNDKQIRLSVINKAAKFIQNTVGDKVDKAIIVHPGKWWPSKTFPKSWWDEIIYGLYSKVQRPVIVIGKTISDKQGYVDVDIPEGVIDFRDKLSLDELIALISKGAILLSNDSAPVHIAGAFDNWIVLIPTCKHPDLVMPYRHGNKQFKSISIYKKLTCDSIDSSPTRMYSQTLDYVNGDILSYLPTANEVVSRIIDIGL